MEGKAEINTPFSVALKIIAIEEKGTPEQLSMAEVVKMLSEMRLEMNRMSQIAGSQDVERLRGIIRSIRQSDIAEYNGVNQLVGNLYSILGSFQTKENVSAEIMEEVKKMRNIVDNIQGTIMVLQNRWRQLPL